MTTRVGLKTVGLPRFEAWLQTGRQIVAVADASAWCMGDWLVFGQEHYCERYRDAIESAGLEYQTLRNYAWVTRRFELWRRREKLSFQHHAEVASLPVEDQDRWLDMAEEGGWSRNHLRRQVRAQREVDNGAAPTTTELQPLSRIRVTGEHIDRWRAAAEQADHRFDEWLVLVLDEAAARMELA